MELKDRIINSAQELFSEKGYDETTVADIIKKAGSSKGGFYHHFKSKDEVLEAVTQGFIGEVIQVFDEILLINSPVIASINDVQIAITRYKVGQVEDWPKLSRIYSFSGNHIILQKMADQFELLITELYTQLIQRGSEEGLFDIKHPKMLAGLWARELMRVLDKSSHLLISDDPTEFKEFEELLDFSENLFNDTLGLKNGEIRIKKPALDYVGNVRERLRD